mgnify:CR=1 FL=1
MANSNRTVEDFTSTANVVTFPNSLGRGGGDGPMGGDGGGFGMNEAERLTKLETHFEYIRRDLDELKDGQTAVMNKLGEIQNQQAGLPTKSDLRQWTLQWIAVCIMAVTLVVGGIVGGLSWLKQG